MVQSPLLAEVMVGMVVVQQTVFRAFYLVVGVVVLMMLAHAPEALEQ